MRATRIMLVMQSSVAIMLAAVLFYLLACWSGPPFHLARASVVTVAYLVISFGAGLLIYQVRSARERSPNLARASSPGAGGVGPVDRDPLIVLRVVRVALVAASVIAGLVLLAGFVHALGLREDTAPMPGWPQASATVTRVYPTWNGSSRTYTAVAEFRADGHTVYFTAPGSADVVKAGDQIRITYDPRNPYLLHDLSAGQAIWKYPLYTSLIALMFVLGALVAGLTLTDRKRIQRCKLCSVSAPSHEV